MSLYLHRTPHIRYWPSDVERFLRKDEFNDLLKIYDQYLCQFDPKRDPRGFGYTEKWAEDVYHYSHWRKIQAEDLDIMPINSIGNLPANRTHPFFGRIRGQEEFYIDYTGTAAQYALLDDGQFFQRHSSRSTELCTFGELEKSLWHIYNENEDQTIFWKNASRPKAHTGVFHSKKEMKDYFIYRSPVYLDEDIPMLMSKEVPMQVEYRFFIVNHTIVTGAGCIDTMHPGFSAHKRDDTNYLDYNKSISTIVEAQRGSRALLNPGAATTIVRRMYEKVQEIIEDLKGITEFTDRSYVIDMYHNWKTDEIGMVEMNNIHNAGFFASDENMLINSIIWGFMNDPETITIKRNEVVLPKNSDEQHLTNDPVE